MYLLSNTFLPPDRLLPKSNLGKTRAKGQQRNPSAGEGASWQRNLRDRTSKVKNSRLSPLDSPLHTNGSSTTLCASRITRRSLPLSCGTALRGHRRFPVECLHSVSTIPARPCEICLGDLLLPQPCFLARTTREPSPARSLPSTPSATASSGNPTPVPIACH